MQSLLGKVSWLSLCRRQEHRNNQITSYLQKSINIFKCIPVKNDGLSNHDAIFAFQMSWFVCFFISVEWLLLIAMLWLFKMKGPALSGV